MLVSFDVEVLEGDDDDPTTATKLRRSFLDNRISMLKMTATYKISFCGIAFYRISHRKPTRCHVAVSPLNSYSFLHFLSMKIFVMGREGV